MVFKVASLPEKVRWVCETMLAVALGHLPCSNSREDVPEVCVPKVIQDLSRSTRRRAMDDVQKRRANMVHAWERVATQKSPTTKIVSNAACIGIVLLSLSPPKHIATKAVQRVLNTFGRSIRLPADAP